MSYGPHLELSVIVSEGARFHRAPLYSEIVHLAHRHGLAGASAFRGIEGFGHSHHVHETHVLGLAGHLPVIIVIVDTEARIRAFAPEVRELVGADVVLSLRAVEMLTPAVGRRR